MVLIFFSFVKYKTLKKIGYVIFYTVFYWNDIFNIILLFETESTDAIRKITLISCICENENNLKWIPFYTKKIWYLLHVFSTSFSKEKYSISRSFSQKSLSSVNVQSTLNFMRNYFSELIWVVTFKQVTFPEYYGFPESQTCNIGYFKVFQVSV